MKTQFLTIEYTFCSEEWLIDSEECINRTKKKAIRSKDFTEKLHVRIRF